MAKSLKKINYFDTLKKLSNGKQAPEKAFELQTFPDWAKPDDSPLNNDLNLKPYPDWANPNDYSPSDDFSFLASLGFNKIIPPDANPQQMKLFAQQLRYVERSHGIQVSLDKIKQNSLKGICREKAEHQTISDVLQYYTLQNQAFDCKNIVDFDFAFPKLGEIPFNKKMESAKFNITHITFDVENGEEQEPIAVGAYNYEANRLVIGIRCEPDEVDLISFNQGHTILVYTPNLWEAVLLADIELVLGTIFSSALQEGHNELVSLAKQFTFPYFPISTSILEEILWNKRRSLWKAHHAAFDINMLNTTAKKAKNKFFILSKHLKHEKVPMMFGKLINPKKEEQIKRDLTRKGKERLLYKTDAYKIHLGSIDAGFRFHAKIDTRISWNGMIRVTLAPIQKGAFPMLWGTDTLTLSMALRNPKHDLGTLSKGKMYEKIAYDEKKIFKASDYDLRKHYTLATKYLIFDLLATLCVYSSQTFAINLETMEKLYNIKIFQGYRPLTSRIVSSATIAKIIIYPYLESRTGLKRDQIENNIIHERQYQENALAVYSGGRAESKIHGKYKPKPPLEIIYDDFTGLYAHSAFLTHADQIYQLAAKRQLYLLQTTDVKAIEKVFWDNLTRIKDLLLKNQPLQPNMYYKLLGTAEVKLKTRLAFRTLNEKPKRRCDKKQKGIKHVHLIDLLGACLREILEKDASLDFLQSKIKFLQADRFDLDKLKTPEFGKDFFSSGIIYRQKIKNKELFPKLTDFERQAAEQTIKYKDNASYGISGEGISNEDVTGKLFMPIIFAAICAGARCHTTILESLCDRLNRLQKTGGKSLYTDTDSLIHASPRPIQTILHSVFEETCKLKEETDYGKILEINIAKKKKYQMKSQYPAGFHPLLTPHPCFPYDNNAWLIWHEHHNAQKAHREPTYPNLASVWIVGKIHGKGQYPKPEFTEAIFRTAKHIFDDPMDPPTGLPNLKAISEKVAKNHPLLQQVSYKTRNNSVIKGLLKFKKKRTTLELGHFKFDNLPVWVLYNILEDTFLVTTIRQLEKSNFGLYGGFAKVGSPYRLKIFYARQYKDENQIAFENRFLPQALSFIRQNKDNWHQEISFAQAKYLLSHRTEETRLLKEQFKEAKFKLAPKTFNRWASDLLDTLKVPWPKSKIYYQLRQIPIFTTKKDWNWFNFLSPFSTKILSSFYHLDGIEDEIEDTKAHYYQKTLFKTFYLKFDPNSSHNYEYLAKAFAEHEIISFSDLLIYIDRHLRTVLEDIFYHEEIETAMQEADVELNFKTIGKQNWNQNWNDLINKFAKEIYKKERFAKRLYNYYCFDEDAFIRYPHHTKGNSYYDLTIIKQGQDCHEETFHQYALADRKIWTDGFDLRLWARLYKLDFSTELLANENQLYTANLINAGTFIASKIYYQTHGKAHHIAELPNKRPEERPCPKTAAVCQIPLKITYLIPDTQYTIPLDHWKQAFDNLQTQELIAGLPTTEEITEKYKTKKGKYKEHIKKKKTTAKVIHINDKKQTIHILRMDLLQHYIKKNILDQAWLVIGQEEPKDYAKTNPPFPKFHQKPLFNRSWAFEILPNQSLEYNAKLLIWFLVGEDRIFKADMHFNPNSRNLLNIELFQTTIRELETNDHVIKIPINELLNDKELTVFSRNASLNLDDLKLKKDLRYQRLITYQALAHMLLCEAIKEQGQTKLGEVTITGQIQIDDDELKPQYLLPFLKDAITEHFEDWLNGKLNPELTKKYPQLIAPDIRKRLAIRANEIQPNPHRASRGITINHWKKNLALSLYLKDNMWYFNKMKRTAKSRQIRITEKMSKEILSRTWQENTLRFEVAMRGFDAIHNMDNHQILKDLEQFLLQCIQIFKSHKRILQEYQNVVSEIKEILPFSIFSNILKTPQEHLISYTKQLISSELDSLGNTLILDQDGFDPP